LFLRLLGVKYFDVSEKHAAFILTPERRPSGRQNCNEFLKTRESNLLLIIIRKIKHDDVSIVLWDTPVGFQNDALFYYEALDTTLLSTLCLSNVDNIFKISI
jgi:hypothetical protein